MNDPQNSRFQRAKSIILYTTISLLVAGAAIAIFMIFFGPTHIFGQILSTIFVLYLMTILSINNLSHTGDIYYSTRICSIIALVANLFWVIPWILLVWDIFGVDNTTAEMIWRFMWTMLVIALYFTVISTQIPFLKKFSGPIFVKRAIPVVLVTYICLNALIFIWTHSVSRYYLGSIGASMDIVFKMTCAEIILLILQWAIPEILLRNQQSKQQNTIMMPSNPNNNPYTQSSSDQSAQPISSSTSPQSRPGRVISYESEEEADQQEPAKSDE